MKKTKILLSIVLSIFLFSSILFPITKINAQVTSAPPRAIVVPESGIPKAIPVTGQDLIDYQKGLNQMYTGYPGTTGGAQSPASAAASGCIGTFLGNAVGGFLSKSLGAILPSSAAEVAAALIKVPTNDFQAKQANFREETLNGIGFCIGNALIDAMSASIVQWINNGFKNPDGTSGPGFLTNPGSFFKQMADREVGAFFQGLGPIGNIVCKPFDLKIRLALLNDYNGRGNSQLCTLTSIKQNLSRFGENGNYLGDWFQLTQEDNNNAIGSYFIARQKMDDGIKYDIETNKMEINLGKGFFSFKKCVSYSSTAKDPNTGKAQCTRWDYTTPGAEVQASLDRAMGSKTHRIEIATNFNQIISALVNQIVVQAVSGLRNGFSSGGSNSNYNTQTPVISLQEQIDALNGLTPEQILGTISTSTYATTTATTTPFDSGYGPLP
jgi:hypothetical protein